MSSWIVSNLWLIPVVPLAVSLVVLSLANPQRSIAALLAIFGQVVALILAIVAFLPTLQTPGFRAVHNFTWFTFGDQALRIGWVLDPLAAAMMVMITLVGLCIFVFSVGYMAGDKNFTRFFAYLWFFLGMLWLYHNSGTLLFYDQGRGCLEDGGLLAVGGSATFIALLIFCGAVGKSGQFPLHVWLPDAMEGPTPVSALIHAATMVAAGVFLVARVYPLFSLGAINGVTASLTVVVWIGVTTALMAALIAIAQADIKRILAYSTVSQLGLMMVSLGVGGVAAGIMHLLAHGFFKALLFLGSGSVIHASHHEQDIRKMGGLRKLMPVTFLTYAIGMMALSGVPLFFAGAWTKEEVLHATAHWPKSQAPYYLMLAGVVLTALYMTRQMIYVFYGNRRGLDSVHESPPVMTRPLIVLALCTIGLSAVLTPAWPWLHDYLSGESANLDFIQLIQPMLFVSLGLVAAGIGLGVLLYRRAGMTDPLQQAQPALFRFLENKMWIDELYAHTVVAFSRAAALISSWLDRFVWE